MASPEERLLALAVARGLLEPEETRGRGLEVLVSSGRLKAMDRALLEQDLAELEAASPSHWSLDMTVAAPEGICGSKAVTTGVPPVSTPLPDPLAGIRTSRAEGLFRVRRLAHWGRFESLELVGEGGMGRIFRATDPRLRRAVALKLLRRDDPDLLQRFLQEAQLQARVDHPNVCRVYEVGEWRGQPYIAMQFIQGETLRQAGPDLDLEVLLTLMVQVCEGVHAAHRVGLVHRDLKPTNLMVERPEEGGLRACVLDFGLARGLESGGVTQTGHVMGTVAYMSPEQAHGDAAQLDRRSDVYSLGATLYTLLTGRPPFEGEGLECMARIAKDDPTPPRRLVPSLPADLETVVLTCLEKDPRRRYPTARALGEDLQRILDREPIQARPATRTERALRWARKRKATVTAAALVLLAALVFGGLAVRENLRAQAQMAYAQRFAQTAERIEALARYLRLQPARNLRPEQADLLARVKDLQAQVTAAGSLAQAPGAYALGRADLALDDPAGARTQLERAWFLGFHAPEAAHALGRALAALYQVEIGKAYALPDLELRQRRIAELDRTLRAPAAAWLKRGASATLEPPTYRDGLLALMQGDPSRAVDLARQAQVEAPWFYEALRLEAEAWIAQARLTREVRPGNADLAAAGGLLDRAERRAPCDVDLLRLDMRRWQEAVALGWQTGADPRTAVTAQVAVADRWLQLEPDSAQALAWRARARGEEARFLAFHDRTPEPWLAQARADAAEALRRNPADLDALTAQASVLRTEGFQRMNQGQDSTGPLDAAVRVADEGLSQDPSLVVLLNIQSSALLAWISVTGMRGTYDRPAALPYLEKALQVARAHPTEVYYQANVGGLAQAMARAELAMGEDPRADAREAVRAYNAALRIQPRHVGVHRGILLAQAVLVEAEARQGEDPGERLAEARKTFQRARDAGVPLQTLAPYLMDAVLAEAAWREGKGLDPRPLVDEAGRLSALLSFDSEDPDAVMAVDLRYLAQRIRTGTPAQAEAAARQGQGIAQRLSAQHSLDPAIWEGLAAFQEASGYPKTAARDRARAKSLNPRWKGF